MFALKKAVSAFLLPPGIFVLFLAASGFSILRKSWRAGMLNIAAGLLLWVLSIGPVSNALLRGLQTGLSVPERPEGDVIILLGGGEAGGLPSGDSYERIVAAAALYRRLRAPVIISGGSVYPWEKAEAPIDARYLASLGVPPGKMLVEDKSRDTLENAVYSRQLCERNGFKRPLLVTSAYHMKRALMDFKLANLPVTACPAGLMKKETRGWASYLPGDLDNSVKALHEYLGIVYTELLKAGKIFKDIK